MTDYEKEAKYYYGRARELAKETNSEHLKDLLDKLDKKYRLSDSSLNGLNDRQVLAIRHVERHDSIKTSQLVELVRSNLEWPNYSRETAQRDLVNDENNHDSLVERGIFKKVGRGAGTKYVLNDAKDL